AIATANSYKHQVEQRGFQHFAGGLEWNIAKIEESLPEICAIPQEEFSDWVLEEIFIDRSPRLMVPHLLEIVQRWSPDVIIAEQFEFGGVIAAELLNLPCARYHISYRFSAEILKRWSHLIDAVRTSFGLPAEPNCLNYHRCLDLCFMPPQWLFPGVEDGGKNPSLIHFIDPLGERIQADPPAWFEQFPSQPTIYMNLGTVFKDQYAKIFDNTVEALREEPFNLIISLGNREADVDRFGPLPKNIHIAPFFPHAETFGFIPHLDLLINHAGPNSVLEALSFGVPLLLFPLSADQPAVTDICINLGVAPSLPSSALRYEPDGMAMVNPPELTPALIRELVHEVMGNPTYRRAAKVLQHEFDALPPIENAVELLKQFVG
ncbi:MAG: glycosyltransferase, partial [Chloroflexota bacterium]